jgi:hypothetical protein
VLLFASTNGINFSACISISWLVWTIISLFCLWPGLCYSGFASTHHKIGHQLLIRFKIATHRSGALLIESLALSSRGNTQTFRGLLHRIKNQSGLVRTDRCE